jgi:arabinose-5-phosphate isomerase
MIEQLLKEEQNALNYFFDKIDSKAFDEVIEIVSNCKGKLVFTGVGKSGLVAKKIATTLTSTGVQTGFLSPINALHGDIGMIQSQDLFLVLSKSGESEELLNLLPFVRNRGAKTIAVISHLESRLKKGADYFLHLPLEKELCPFNLAPTISSTIQLIFGDILIVALMKKRRFSLEEYALNHPAGQIGKRSSVKVSDLMLKQNLPFCSSSQTLASILEEFSEKRCGCVLVVDEKLKLEGIFTDGDLRRQLQKRGGASLELPLSVLMSQCSKVIAPDRLAYEALQMMEEDQKSPVTVLPVLDHKKEVVGLIKMHDLIQSGIA